MNITLNIHECCISRCFQSEKENYCTITSLNTEVLLQNGYTLEVIAINGDDIVIKLENDTSIIYRILNPNFPFEICLCSSCYSTYFVTINITIN